MIGMAIFMPGELGNLQELGRDRRLSDLGMLCSVFAYACAHTYNIQYTCPHAYMIYDRLSDPGMLCSVIVYMPARIRSAALSLPYMPARKRAPPVSLVGGWVRTKQKHRIVYVTDAGRHLTSAHANDERPCTILFLFSGKMRSLLP